MAGKTAVSARKKMCCCVRMLHPLPKNVFSSCLVSTLVITTHPPRCCVDHARLVADKLANGKEPKEARRPAPHNRYRDGAPRTPAGLLLAVVSNVSRRLLTTRIHSFVVKRRAWFHPGVQHVPFGLNRDQRGRGVGGCRVDESDMVFKGNHPSSVRS